MASFTGVGTYITCKIFHPCVSDASSRHASASSMKKSDVNGENAIELFKYLKSQKTFEGFGKGPKALAMSAMLKKIDKDYKNNSEIKWNFTKFLVDRQGNVVERFGSTTTPEKIDAKVAELL